MNKKIKPIHVGSGKNIKSGEDTVASLDFDYPIFCFRHLNKKYGIDKCEKNLKIDFIERVIKLSTMTWLEIRQSHHHSFGMEKIPQKSIKAGIPDHLTPDENLYAFRYSGKKPFVGYKSQFIFHVVYIDNDFSLYDHG